MPESLGYMEYHNRRHQIHQRHRGNTTAGEDRRIAGWLNKMKLVANCHF